MNVLIEKPCGQGPVTNGANRLGPCLWPYLVYWLRANLWASFPSLEKKKQKKWLIWMGFRMSLGSSGSVTVKFCLLDLHIVCVPVSIPQGAGCILLIISFHLACCMAPSPPFKDHLLPISKQVPLGLSLNVPSLVRPFVSLYPFNSQFSFLNF